MPKTKITKKQYEQDAIIIGAIIAGSQEKPLKPDLSSIEVKNGICAIGSANTNCFVGQLHVQ